MLVIAALLIIAIGIAHSYLGEKYIFVRLFRQPLPKLFGNDQFTKQTLRFAWHITTIAWLGFAVLLLTLYLGDASESSVLMTIGVTFAASAITVLGSRRKHLSWVAFGAIAIICITSSAVT